MGVLISAEDWANMNAMVMRLAKVAEERHLLRCVKHHVWGSNSHRSFGGWRNGDLLLLVCGGLAAIAEITGTMYYSPTPIWDNGVFPYRVPVQFTYLLDPASRPQVVGEVRNALIREWGPAYGVGILNKRPLSEKTAKLMMDAMTTAPNVLKSKA